MIPDHARVRLPVRLPDLPSYVAFYAHQTPDAVAAEDGFSSLRYAELEVRVSAFAQALIERGVRPGDRVAFQGPPGLPFWVSLLGTQRAGAVWLGLNPAYTSRELLHVLRDATPVLVLAAPAVEDSSLSALSLACEEAALGAPCQLEGTSLPEPSQYRQFRRTEGDRGLPAEPVPAQVSLIVYTSGSTGAPKGAMLTSTGLVENGWWLAQRMGFRPLRGLVNLPVNHVGCVGDLCATLLVAGGTLVFMERFDATAAVKRIVDAKVEWLPQVPAQFQLMVNKGGMDATALRSVRHLTWGGAAMPEPLVRQLQDWVPDVFNSYGLTECSGTITLTAHGATVDELTGTVGRPVAPGLLRIADGAGLCAPQGEVGEVQIRGPHVFLGYLGRPEATASAFTPDGWLRTSDLGMLDGDGNLHLRGRTQDMFKSGGYNVYPREVETVIESMPGVELCAVVAVPDPLWNEVGVAFVQGDRARLMTEDLRHHCQTLLARYKVPKEFVVRPALPLLPIGKVDKAALRSEAINRAQQ